MVPIYAKRIRQIRQELGLTQPEFAMRLGTTKNQISKYELNKEPIPVKHIIKICDEFNVSADWLLGIGESKVIEFKEPLWVGLDVGNSYSAVQAEPETAED